MVQSIDEARRRSAQNTPSTGQRIPPHNLDAESALIGAMLLSRDAVANAIETVTTDDFYKPSHGTIYSAISILYARGDAIDVVTVAEELRRTNLLESIGGAATLVAIQSNTPAIGNSSTYANIVSEHSMLRRLISVAGEIAEIGYSIPNDVVAAIDEAEAMVFDVARHRGKDSIAKLYDLLTESMDRLQLLADRGDHITGVPTGFTKLDACLAGLQSANLIIVGARPAMGKTAFALSVASNAALQIGTPVLLFSLEMSHMEIAQRLLGAEALVDAAKLRNGQLQDQDWSRLETAISHLSEAPIFVDDNPNLTVMDIRAKARRLASRNHIGLIIVDYLQLMSGRRSAENRQVEVSEISRGLKILARELNIPVIALSQLSRTLESRADKRPTLADLRESGSLEQDADVVMFLYREEMYTPDTTDKGIAEVIVAKHRNGPTDSVRLVFRGQFSRFDNAASL
ncbi:MAG: replicative DNA helicase [Acidimicrobiales bacterium]|nr:replicative DNA helicase [Acidimicrobiales bacterium]